jgi:hypothetical protein
MASKGGPSAKLVNQVVYNGRMGAISPGGTWYDGEVNVNDDGHTSFVWDGKTSIYLSKMCKDKFGVINKKRTIYFASPTKPAGPPYDWSILEDMAIKQLQMELSQIHGRRKSDLTLDEVIKAMTTVTKLGKMGTVESTSNIPSTQKEELKEMDQAHESGHVDPDAEIRHAMSLLFYQESQHQRIAANSLVTCRIKALETRVQTTAQTPFALPAIHTVKTTCDQVHLLVEVWHGSTRPAGRPCSSQPFIRDQSTKPSWSPGMPKKRVTSTYVSPNSKCSKNAYKI